MCDSVRTKYETQGMICSSCIFIETSKDLCHNGNLFIVIGEILTRGVIYTPLFVFFIWFLDL